jgi:hypothetical protein
MRAATFPPARLAPLALGLLAACGQWEDRTRALEVAREALGCFEVALEQTESHRFHAEGCGGTADVACSEGSLNPVCIRVAERGTSGSERPPREVIDEEGAGADAPEPDAPSLAEATIRRGLDARAADVLACVDRESVAVRVTHAADGQVAITLSGELRGSPEEGCVRAALGEVRAPAGEAGVVVHLVRARRSTTEAPAPEAPAPEAPAPEAPAPEAPAVLEGSIVEELD